jgi:hypothetical protein
VVPKKIPFFHGGREEFGMAVRWLVALNLILVGTAISSHVSAEEPTFPLLQEGKARLAFVSSATGSCTRTQRGNAQNASLSTAEIGAYCLCYARALADGLSGADYEAMMLGQTNENLVKKTKLASNLCRARMTPSEQKSERERELVTLKNQCLKQFQFRPEETDHAAAVLRDGYCTCFAGVAAKSSDKPMNPNEAADYCSKHFTEYY